MRLSKTSLSTLAVISTLLLSGISIPVVSADSRNSRAYTFPSAQPTYAGTASAFLSGPTIVSPPYDDPAGATASLSGHLPNVNPKPNMGTDPPPTARIPPAVNCNQFGSSFFNSLGCDSISLNPGGARTNPNGLNAYENLQVAQNLGAAYGTVEPSDQGLCAGNGYVMQVENEGILQVFNTGLNPVSSVISLDSIMGLTGLGWSGGGDIMCQYDYSSGGHWFITEFVSASSEASGGPFAGCFVAVPDTCYEGIAVSVTSNPLGSYYVYFFNPNTVNSDPGSDANPSPTASQCTGGGLPSNCGQGVLLNDYVKTATTKDAFLLFYDEFPLYGGFNGAQQLAFSKYALEHGLSSVNVAYENMGSASNLYPIPANGVYQPFALTSDAWYQVIPAQTTDPSEYANNNGGTGFMVASLDFFGTGDNRVAVFDWTGLSNLNSPGCGACSGISFGGQLLTGSTTYQDESDSCFASDYATVSTHCSLAPQKSGPIPLGDLCAAVGFASGVTSCPESGVATNGDGATQAFYAQGEVWTAVSTIVSQNFGRQTEYHLGATYWGVAVSVGNNQGNSNWFGNGDGNSQSGVTFSINSQGVVSASHEDLAFPAVAATEGSVLMAFTLSGNGGPTGADHGGFYPSTAYVMLSTGWGGFGQNVIHVADLGASPTDGFTEYAGYSATSGIQTTIPRWGDYNQAVFDPSTGRFFFATQFIQHPNCGDSAFLSDPTCGGTRSPFANWGNSLNSVFP